MSVRRLSGYVVGVSSVLILLSSFAHGFAGWSKLRQALQGTIDPDLLGAVAVGWHFGSTAMAAFGLLGLLSVWQMHRGHLQARWTPVTIGVAYVVFGAAVIAVRGPKPHFLAFVLLGSLLLAGGMTWKRRG